MKNSEFNADLTVVGALLTLIIVSGVYFETAYKQNKQIQELQANYKEAKKLVIRLDSETREINDKLTEIASAYNVIKDDLSEVQTLIKIKDNLRGYSLEEKAIGLAIAWTESTWNFDANHKSDAEGICGVIPDYWEDYLKYKNIDVNSVAACIEIYKFYKDENKGSKEKAIKEYKGIENNIHLIEKTLKIRDKILKILKESK